MSDGLTTSWLCADCRVNTAPGFPDGPTLRAVFAMGGSCEATLGTEHEVYVVRSRIWAKAGMRPWGGCLCIGCLERRLDRQLAPRDFSPGAELNRLSAGSMRLRDRRGY